MACCKKKEKREEYQWEKERREFKKKENRAMGMLIVGFLVFMFFLDYLTSPKSDFSRMVSRFMTKWLAGY